MAIESKTFRGTRPPADRSPNERLAVEALNEWRSANLNARIISIETLMVVTPSSPDQSKFDGVRVWFELSAT